MKYFLIYLCLINLVSAVVCISDKRRAINGKWRIKESTLMLLSALGGAPMMYITMRIIRHKTKKVKFMLGIPLIFVIECVLFYIIAYYLKA